MLLLLALLVYIYIGLYLPKIPKIDETLFKNIQLYQYWNRDYVLGVDYLLKVELLEVVELNGKFSAPCPAPFCPATSVA